MLIHVKIISQENPVRADCTMHLQTSKPELPSLSDGRTFQIFLFSLSFLQGPLVEDVCSPVKVGQAETVQQFHCTASFSLGTFGKVVHCACCSSTEADAQLYSDTKASHPHGRQILSSPHRNETTWKPDSMFSFQPLLLMVVTVHIHSLCDTQGGSCVSVLSCCMWTRTGQSANAPFCAT